MKKFIVGMIVGIMLTSSIAFGVSYVAEPASFKVMVNGEEFVSDPPTLVVQGSTYLPLRAMGDALGVPVNWNEELRQAEVGMIAPEVSNSNITQISDNWKMTFLNCKEYNEIDGYIKPEDGKKFVVATFELENISQESQTFSFLNLNSYIDDYKTPLNIMATQIDGATMFGANTIEPGKKMKGYLSYQVDPGWKKIDIIYQEDIFNEAEPIKFTINK